MSLKGETLSILKANGIIPNKKLGQNFLIDEGIIKKEVSKAQIVPGETVLEIGPGIGNLTKFLLDEGAGVIAIEKDSRMVKILEERFPDKHLEIIQGDSLKVDFPDFDKCISNIPYVISSPLTFKLLEHRFERAVLLYQKEFARRLVAEPDTRDYSRISVSAYYFSKVRILDIIPPSSFWPPPKVDSAVVEIIPRESPPFEVEEDFFFRFLKGIFTHRRKTLNNAIFDSFPMIFGSSPERGQKRDIIRNMLDEDTLNKRVFKLSPEELGEISELLRKGHELSGA